MIRSRRTASTAPNYIILSIFAIFALMPILMLFMNSIKTTSEISLLAGATCCAPTKSVTYL